MEQLQIIQSKIYEIRGQKVMLDFDLASMYSTETKYLKRSVKNNLKRFPSDLCIVLITFPCLQMISSFLHSLTSPSVNRLNINTKR